LILFFGSISTCVYGPKKKNQKAAQKNPKIDGSWVLGQLLRNCLRMDLE